MISVLKANSCVIDEMARAINMKPWRLHKRILRFYKYYGEGLIDIKYHKIGLKITKKGYRGCRFIPVIVDYTLYLWCIWYWAGGAKAKEV